MIEYRSIRNEFTGELTIGGLYRVTNLDDGWHKICDSNGIFLCVVSTEHLNHHFVTELSYIRENKINSMISS